MPVTRPTSWTPDRNVLLSELITPVAAFPAGKVVSWNEVTDDRSTRDARLSRGVNSAATMAFMTESTTFTDPSVNKIAVKTILGGYSDLNGKKNTPLVHPYFTGMYAKDIISVKEMSIIDPLAGPKPQYAKYNVAQVVVSYESVNYPFTQSIYDYNPNWIEVRTRASNMRVATSLGFYIYQSGAYANFPAQLGTFMTQPQSFIELTIHECSYNSIFGAGGNLKPLFGEFCGLINNSAFASNPAESLLLDSVEILPYRDPFGLQIFDVKMSLIYNAWTWNKQPDLANILRTVVYAGATGVKPFTTFFLTTLINQLNPL